MARIGIIEGSDGLARYFTRHMAEVEHEVFPIWKDRTFPEVNDFDAYIITGDYNNISDGLQPYHLQEMNFIRKLGSKKVYGSCFAHQLIAQMYNGKGGRRELRFFGWNKMKIINDHTIFQGMNDPYFLSLNGDEVVTKPENADVLAVNAECRYQVLSYGDNMITCQAHPEILKDEAMETIREHESALLIRCGDLHDIVDATEGFANDEASKRFLGNIVEWLVG